MRWGIIVGFLPGRAMQGRVDFRLKNLATSSCLVVGFVELENRMSAPLTLALQFSPSVWAIIGIVGVALLGVAWFAAKFWLASTRPADIREVQTPTLDRLNQRALAALGDDEEDEDEAPEGLKEAVDEPHERKHEVIQ